jgi:PKD repeat protein
MTVHVDTRGSTDIDGDRLYHSVSFGDGAKLAYPDAWHTYKEPGTYIIEAKVSDVAVGGRGNTKTSAVTVEVVSGNQAPIARLTGRRYRESIDAYGRSSFDWEGTPLTYEWDFGDGPFVGNAFASVYDCGSSSSANSSSSSNSSSYASYDRTRLVTLTVSDGELKDTVQQTLGGSCGLIQDKVATAAFSYVVEGNKVSLDASESRDETAFNWDFGDGTVGTGLFTSHTYASPGTYEITLRLTNMGSYGAAIDTITKSIVIESVSSIASSSVSSSSSFNSSSSVSSSSISSSMISSSTSSIRSSSSQASSDRNRYIAPRATTAPVIDGVVDSVWDRASWAPIDVFWLGTQPNPSAQDYSGRYKALWDENYLYILYDITDDVIYDGVRDVLDRYWEDDTVELFVDENKNGGQHGYNTSAWAYHISTYGDVVDSTTGGATLLNNHIDNRLVSNGNQHYWEMRIRIYGEDYADWKSNTPLQLYAGKLMGFSACYIDNDGSSQRESMMGSVDTAGHKNNQGYLDAGSFGSLLLAE